MVVIVLDLEDVFPFFLNDISVSTYCKEAIATTLSLSPMAPRTSLVIMVLFTGLVLIGELSTRHINRGGISRLILFRVLFLAGLCSQ